MDDGQGLKQYKINIKGIVQGVGFRPFIYRLAKKHGLKGEVYNTTEGVIIIIETAKKNVLDSFIDMIKEEKPAPSLIEDLSVDMHDEKNDYDDFSITSSRDTKERFQLISPDISTCKNCLEDIAKKDDLRRYGYAFTNCTNCGPRFTIIKKLPYDRKNTTMSKFRQCPACKSEYLDITDRRFHAQPNACSICGPRLRLLDNKGVLLDDNDPISLAAEKILEGRIIAIKGLGGFQIACDALNDSSVGILRARKKRPFKPFAVMFKDLEMASSYVRIGSQERQLLTSSHAPIVLLEKNYKNKLSRSVSFSNRYDGSFLPYTPLHHILLEKVNRPLVMTSGNISEEPIASDNNEALQRLSGICDYFLTHDRGIYSKYDDSVVKVVKGKEMIIRRARGYAPYPIKLSECSPKTILATGAQEKNTFCILKDRYAIVSQHIGELDDMDSYDFYLTTIKKYLSLFNIEKIDAIAYDKHPDYFSTRFALDNQKVQEKIPVQHHEAHLASVMAENSLDGGIIGFLWDGTGFGHDKNIWGSEIFIIDKKLNIDRVAHLEEIGLPGGDVTIKKPYRMAITYLYDMFKKTDSKCDFEGFIFKRLPHYKKIISLDEIKIIESQLNTGYNTVSTTSMGRLFDAISSAIDLTHINTFEGQAAIDLEMSADLNIEGAYKHKIRGLCEFSPGKQMLIDSSFIFSKVISDIQDDKSKGIISSKFHNTLVNIVSDISKRLKKVTGFDKIALSGGVFQNGLLLSRLYDRLCGDGFKVYINQKVPVNDGGISLGQAFMAMHRILKGED